MNEKPLCPICLLEPATTKDHRVPSWFINKLYFFGTTVFEVSNRAELSSADLVWRTCPKCNHEKNGFMDYYDPIVKRFMQAFYEIMNEKLQINKKKTLKIKCVCHNTEAVPSPMPLLEVHRSLPPKFPGESEPKYQARIKSL